MAWTQNLRTSGPFNISLAGANLVLATQDAPMEAYSLDDGRVLWTAAVGSDIAPLALDGVVIGFADRRLQAVDESTGAPRWSVALTGDSLGPVAIGHTVIAASGTTISAYRPGDGARLWQAELGATSVAGVAVSDTMAVVALSDRSVAAFDLQTGHPLWRVLLEIVPSVLSVALPRIFFGTADGYVCALKTADGQLDWCFSVKVPAVGPPIVDKKSVYFAFLDGGVRVFSRGNGARRQNLPLNARPQAGPQLVGSQIAIPVVTAEFVLLDTTKQLTATRVASPAAKDGASLLASALASDGERLAMVTVSPSGTSLVCMKKTPPAAPAPTTGAPGAVAPPAAQPPAPPTDGSSRQPPTHAPR